MDFYEALELLKNKKVVESLVSRTTYEFGSEGLLAEGLPVSFDYMTEEEANGKWREVTMIETQEEYESLSLEDKQKLLSCAYENAKFNEKYGR